MSVRPTILLALVLVASPAAATDPAVPWDIPPSWTVPGLATAQALPAIDLPPVDVAALRAEDAVSGGDGFDKPMRVGFPMKTDIDPERDGVHESLGAAGDLWRVKVRTAGARWVVLGFGTFRPDDGERLYVYDPDGRRVLGPFTVADERADGQLWMPPVAGDALIVEVYRPADAPRKAGGIHLGTVSHGYEPWGGIGIDAGGPGIDSGSCNNDVNCPLGANWQDEKRGVVNLLTNGSGYCSGSLIATTASDCENLVLTANHCLTTQSKAASTTFQFNFERPQCGSGIAPTDQVVTGADLVATYSGSDFTLMRITSEIPEAYDPFYNGWSRDTTAGTESWGIHHPSNDEKAITFNQDPLVDGQNYGPDHWRINQWEDGTTEPGSSGSPLFDQNHRIVGQLHGGTASCTSLTWDEYGKLDVSWNGAGTAATSLAPHLDPQNTGAIVLDGLDGAACRIPQPRLSHAGHAADDTQGNADGTVDPGERIVLTVDLRNGGTLGATGISGLLTPESAGVSMVDAAADWPDLAIDATASSLAPHFTFDVDPGVACGTSLRFRLDLTPAEDPGAGSDTFEVATGTANVATEFQDDVESGVNGWTVQTLEGANAWTQTTADSFSPTHAWFVQDVPTRSDAVAVLPTLNALAANAVLRFRHRYNTESSWDGGVLEYSADGGPWTDAATLITSGGYSGSVNASASSNLAGRAAWLGDSAGWRAVEADLSSLAGSDVVLRWRFATDTSVGDEGWYVDDVVVDVTTYACNDPVVQLPGEASDPSGPGPAFTIDKDPGGYRLAWSAPVTGGPVVDYVLYATDLFGAKSSSPACEAALGSGTEAVLADLTADRGFLVVSRNAAGEGSHGTDGGGGQRPAASGGAVCP